MYHEKLVSHTYIKYVNLLKPKTYFMYHQLLTFRNSVFCPQCIYVFCVDLRTNSDYVSIQQKLIGFYKRGGECLLRGTNWVFKLDRYSFVLKGLNNAITKSYDKNTVL